MVLANIGLGKEHFAGNRRLHQHCFGDLCCCFRVAVLRKNIALAENLHFRHNLIRLLRDLIDLLILYAIDGETWPFLEN